MSYRGGGGDRRSSGGYQGRQDNRSQDRGGNRGGYGRKSDYGKKWDQSPDAFKKKTPVKNETESPARPATEEVTKSDPKPEAVDVANVNGAENVVENDVPPETPIDEPKNEEEEPKTAKISRYIPKPNEKKFSGRCRLFVANLPNTTTEDELREMFEQFGETGELFINKEKGFAFIRLDYRHNAEVAKSQLDKLVMKGRTINVRYATHASAIELHGLNQFASNEHIETAMSQFGQVERAIVVCDDRGRSKGYAVVEFAWKKSAQKVLDRFKEELFCLGRLPKPVYAKPLSQVDEEEGVREGDLERLPGYPKEREFGPRFISPSSFEYEWARKWRQLFIEEEDKKARLEHELREQRYRLEMEMEAAMHQLEANKMREELLRRQEELRRFEEEMVLRPRMELAERDRMQQRSMEEQQVRYTAQSRGEVDDIRRQDFGYSQNTGDGDVEGVADLREGSRQDLSGGAAGLLGAGSGGYDSSMMYQGGMQQLGGMHADDLPYMGQGATAQMRRELPSNERYDKRARRE